MGRGLEDNLGVVDTIYEEENDRSSSSPSLSHSLSSPLTPLHARVESWSTATGKQPDVSIYVMGTCFRLHKEPVTSRSGYLKRQLKLLSEITLPLNISAETFSQVADFCYGTHVVINPFNVAALRTASELLEMMSSSALSNGDNLSHVTETYFRRVVAVDSELAMIVFRSCLRLLPEAETTAALVSRCVEALDLSCGVEDELEECVEEIVGLRAEEFMIVADAFQCRFDCHDFLYRLVDLYIKDQSGKITEEQKSEICNIIDCDKLSPHFLIHAVQNPRLPLRFIVRAMLIEQLNTRRAIFTAANSATSHHTRTGPHSHSTNGFTTLDSILRKDAVARNATQMKAEMNATSSRIESLEKELAGMKKLLQKSDKEIRKLREKKLLNGTEKVKGGEVEERVFDDDDQKLVVEIGKKERGFMESIPEEIFEDREGRSVMQSSKSSSFHYGHREAEIKRGERGSISFASSRFAKGCLLPSHSDDANPRTTKNVRRKGLISRLMNALWVSKPATKYGMEMKDSKGGQWNGVGDGEEVVIVSREEANPAHRRKHTLGELHF